MPSCENNCGREVSGNGTCLPCWAVIDEALKNHQPPMAGCHAAFMVGASELPFERNARENVYAAIDRERDYQDSKWNPATTSSGGRHSVVEFLVFMQHYLSEAIKHASIQGEPAASNDCLNDIRKLTALGVACMEQNGVVQRELGRKLSAEGTLTVLSKPAPIQVPAFLPGESTVVVSATSPISGIAPHFGKRDQSSW